MATNKCPDCPTCIHVGTGKHLCKGCAERLLAELTTLRAENKRYEERLQFDPGGSDKIDELEEAVRQLRFLNENLRAENERL